MSSRIERARRNALAPTSKALLALADLSDVPAEHRASYFRAVRANVQTACELDGLTKGGLAKRKRTALHQAARTLYDTLGNLNRREREFLKNILNDKAEFSFDEDELERAAYQLAKLFSVATGRALPRRAEQSRQGGRGTLKHPRFQKFICDFLISTTAAGGNLTLNKNGRDGTLIDAINMLGPHLPNSFNSEALSFSTFQRLKTRCKAGFVDHT